MPKEFHLSVVAPDRSVVEETITSLVAPGHDGYFGVMAGHEPLIAALRPGILEYVGAGSNARSFVYTGGGFAEVNGSKVTILADEAQPASEIDVAHAEEKLEEARKALRGEASELNTEQATEEIEKALQRIRAARMGR